MPTIQIREADAGDIPTVRILFEEYAAGLDVDLAFQDFARELAELPGAYAPPAGALLLAWRADQPLGCVAVRAFSPPAIAELKRLYVRPAARGLRLGEQLTRIAIAHAREAGYRRLRLDTLPDMQRAQRLYRELGFREILPYRHNPIPGTFYMELDLEKAVPAPQAAGG